MTIGQMFATSQGLWIFDWSCSCVSSTPATATDELADRSFFSHIFDGDDVRRRRRHVHTSYFTLLNRALLQPPSLLDLAIDVLTLNRSSRCDCFHRETMGNKHASAANATAPQTYALDREVVKTLFIALDVESSGALDKNELRAWLLRFCLFFPFFSSTYQHSIIRIVNRSRFTVKHKRQHSSRDFFLFAGWRNSLRSPPSQRNLFSKASRKERRRLAGQGRSPEAQRTRGCAAQGAQGQRPQV